MLAQGSRRQGQAPNVPWRERIEGADLAVAFSSFFVLSFFGSFLAFGYYEQESPAWLLLLQVVVGPASLASVGVMVALPATKTSAASIGLGRAPWGWLLVGAAAGLLGALLTGAVELPYAWAFGEASALSPEVEDAALRFTAAQSVLAASMFYGLGPLGEELFFRGVIYTYCRRWGVAAAAAVSSLLFGLVHGLDVTLVSASLFGVILALLYERSGSVWPSVAAHAAGNVLISVLVPPLLDRFG